MNIILADAEEFDGNKLLLSDHRAKHIVKILGCKEGDTIRCGEINGLRGEGKIISMQRKFPFHVVLEVELMQGPPQKTNIDLLLALPRPIMLRRILSQATSLGVGKIILIHANRVEKSFWDASLLESGGCREHLIHGLEQSVDTRLPHVEMHQRFKPFIENTFPEIKNDYSHLLLAHPGENTTLSQRILSVPSKTLFAIGPEGGWVDYEVTRLKDSGFTSFSIGDRILKVDTAVIAVHSRISAVVEGLS
jgi:16S rRNA (uracil1498-N3)-methyltransferase